MAQQPPFPVLPSTTCELAEGTLSPIVHIINEDVEQYCPHINTWGALLGIGLQVISVLL